MFAIHGNVRDIVPLRRPGKTEFPSLHQFLREALFGRRDLVLTYDRGGGISFAHPDMQADFRTALAGYDAFHGSSYSQSLPRNPDGVLNMLESYLRVRVADGKTIAVILDFAETIAPAGDGSTMGSEDRNTIVILKRWAQNLTFLRADVTICLIAENLSDLNQGIVQNPGVAAIRIPHPDESERLEFIQSQLTETALPAGSDVSDVTLSKLTAGLKRVQLQSLICYAYENRQPMTLKFLMQRKKDLIEAESGGLLEFVQSRFDLSTVAGHEPDRGDCRRGRRAARRPLQLRRQRRRQSRFRADRAVHGQHRAAGQGDLVPAHLPSRPAAGRSEAAGPRRGAHRAVLSRYR